MVEIAIKIGKTPEPKGIKVVAEKTEQTKKQIKRMRSMKVAISIGIITIFILYFSLTKGIEKGPKHIPGNEQFLAIDAKDEIQNREIITADMLKANPPKDSIAEIEQRHPNKHSNKRTHQSNMVVLSESSSPGSEGARLSLQPTTIIEAHLDGKVVASSSQTPIVAIVDQGVEQNGKILIPPGSKIVGFTSGIHGSRVSIQFSKIIFSGSASIFGFSGIAMDQDKTAGLAGELNQNSVYKTGTSLASTLIELGAAPAFEGNQSVFGEVARRTIDSTSRDLSDTVSGKSDGEYSAPTISLPNDLPIKIMVID